MNMGIFHGHVCFAGVVTFTVQATEFSENHLSHEKNPGWLGYIGDYTTQLYRDYNKLL